MSVATNQAAGPFVERFKAALADVLKGTSLQASEVFELAEERCQHSYVELTEALERKSTELERILTSCANRQVTSLCLLPVPSYIGKCAEHFRAAFGEVILCDNKKAGQTIAGLTVLSQSELDSLERDADAYLNTTPSREVSALFADSIPSGRSISFDDFASELMKSGGRSSMENELPRLVERIGAAKHPLVVFCGIYLNTYTPTLAALAERGYSIFVIARSATAWIHAGHLAKIGETLEFAEVQTVDAEGMLWLAHHIDRGAIFLPGAEESFIGCSFDCRRAAAANAYVAALERLAHVPVLLGLYDIIKPVVKQLDYQRDSIQTYTAMLTEASAVTIGANTPAAGEQVVNALALQTPVSSFYRYGVFTKDIREKHADGIHLAIVGGALVSESENPFLPDHSHFRVLLDQGIHLHVYSSAAEPLKFQDGLSVHQASHFHIHASITDPHALTSELSQYHAGMILNDTATLVDMTATFTERFLRELAYHFMTTMTPSASMLYGCAGIPIVINRTSSSLQTEFPSEYFIPTELSEFGTLGSRLRSMDWERIHRVTEAERAQFSIQANVEKLVATLQTLR